jgi:hypothetical protein
MCLDSAELRSSMATDITHSAIHAIQLREEEMRISTIAKADHQPRKAILGIGN